jgi:hypothetical protein
VPIWVSLPPTDYFQIFLALYLEEGKEVVAVPEGSCVRFLCLTVSSSLEDEEPLENHSP